jgi:hypothetical protein
MANWSQLLPTEGPPEVQAALAEVVTLRERVQPQREAVAAAQRGIVEAESADRERVARELREGTGAGKADDSLVTKAQQRASLAAREAEGLALAISDAERALGEVVHAQRSRWLRDAERREAAARKRAGRVIEELRAVLEGWGAARGARVWLTHGLEHQQPASAAFRLELVGSERLTANQEAIPVNRALDMLTASVAEREPQTQPQAAVVGE